MTVGVKATLRDTGGGAQIDVYAWENYTYATVDNTGNQRVAIPTPAEGGSATYDLISVYADGPCFLTLGNSSATVINTGSTGTGLFHAGGYMELLVGANTHVAGKALSGTVTLYLHGRR